MSEEHKEATRKMLAVMQAYVDGQPIEVSAKGEEWGGIVVQPGWNWDAFRYRIATIPDIIDWSHVAPQFKFLARDHNCEAYVYEREPRLRPGPSDKIREWYDGGDCVRCRYFASYKRGTVDWKDSLVIRPE